MSCRNCQASRGGSLPNHNCHHQCICPESQCYFRVTIPCAEFPGGVVPPPPVVGGGESQIYLAADVVAAATEYVGVGSSSNNFARNTVVIPQNAIITGMVFNIRDNTLAAGQSATADIVLSKTCAFGTIIDTGITATVAGPNNATTPNCCARVTANYPVAGCDLLSVRVTTTGGGALQEGVAITISYIIP